MMVDVVLEFGGEENQFIGRYPPSEVARLARDIREHGVVHGKAHYRFDLGRRVSIETHGSGLVYRYTLERRAGS